METSNKILSDITVHMKYARYNESLKRREDWYELVTRNMNMHIKKHPSLKDEIRGAYQYVYDKRSCHPCALCSLPASRLR